MIRPFVLALWGLFPLADGAFAQGPLNALARPDLSRSEIVDLGANLQITLTLSQPVPWRIFTVDNPPRLVVDFSQVDWTGQSIGDVVRSDVVTDIRTGATQRDWSRLVLSLAEPMALETAGLGTAGTSGQAVLKVQMAPVDAVTFAKTAGPPPGVFAGSDGPEAIADGRGRQTGERPLVVVLDPGHGGVDPGAEADGVVEADLMLTFAKDLRQVLEESGRFSVVMTREEDVFVPLESRLTVARTAGADVFLSLHADALAEGRASGATIYTLSSEASDDAARVLSERHQRTDLLGGVDLSEHDDVIAGVLMNMARLNTTPRAERLAGKLVTGLSERTGDLHKRPRLRAGFSVLKAPDIPSALIELGFLSSARDRDRLTDAGWRRKAALGIRDALLVWSQEDADEARLLNR